MEEFIWTQTALKDLEKEQTCPFRWNSQWLESKPEFRTIPPSIYQDYGNYFEYLCIGKNAKSEGVKELPLTAAGAKTAVQKRIEQQALKFKDLFENEKHKDFLGFSIIDTQVKFKGDIEGVPVQGTADIEAEDSLGVPVIIDLKLTEDANNTRTEYGWGNDVETLDLLQQVLYRELYYQIYGTYPRMILAIFEYGVNMGVQIWELDISDGKEAVMISRFKSGVEVVDLYNKNGWIKIPSEKECEKCPLKCDERFVKPSFVFKKVNY